MIDISVLIQYDLAQAERRFLTMINAMVSHELRNPLNSIQNQNMHQQIINDKILELIQDDSISDTVDLRERMIRMLPELFETNEIQIQCASILNFMVNDLLDFAQLSQGRFRQVNHQFNLIQALEDILSIQKYKADEFGINLKIEYENFEQMMAQQKQIQLQMNDVISICADKKRLQ